MKPRPIQDVDRRDFLRSGVAAGFGTAATGSVAAADEVTDAPKKLALRAFGKTGRKLPVLGYGGAALPKYAYDRGMRYFDTAGNYLESQAILGKALKGIRENAFLVSKVETTDPGKVRGNIEKALAELQTDYLDTVLIHGTPGLEQMSVERAMMVHAELVKLREEKMIRFIGFSAHSYFDKALALISSGGFDQCMLSYGYLPRGHNQTFSPRMLDLREACVAKAHELNMGLVAMKVVGGGFLGAWSGYIVPGFDKKRIGKLPGAAIRYVLNDQRFHLLVIGMRLKSEVDANINTFTGDTTYTDNDKTLLTEFSKQALASKAMKSMRVD